MIRRENYPVLPMSALPTTLLTTFQAERAIEDNPKFDAPWLDQVKVQTAYSAFHGARSRSLVCFELQGHDRQAAAIIVAANELDVFLEGAHTRGGRDAVRQSWIVASWPRSRPCVRPWFAFSLGTLGTAQAR